VSTGRNKKETDMPNVGLVLSGGFAKGAYQIGVLNAIKEVFGEEQDKHIKYISASSVGALNAYAFAQNKVNVVEDLWRGLKFSGLRSFFSTAVRGSFVAETVSEIYKDTQSITTDLYITCFNIKEGKLNYINLKDVEHEHEKDYLLASVAMPILAYPVEVAGRKYVDGALVDNIPVKPLMRHPFEYAIVVHFDNDNYVFENDFFDSRLIKINFLDDNIIKNSLAFNRDSIAHMMKMGYDVSMTMFDTVFKKGTDDVEYIYEKIQFFNEFRGRRKTRLTGDVVVNNINKAMKRFISYRI